MVTIRKLVLILLGILTLLAFSIFILRGILYPHISVPDKYKLVRYYACMLAICTKGCGHDYLSFDESNPNDIAICVERDPVTKDCKKWCQDICDEMNWGNGRHCGKEFNVTINLEGLTQLKGIYEFQWIVSITTSEEHKRAKTEIFDILHHLNKTENFPSIGLLDEVKYTIQAGRGAITDWHCTGPWYEFDKSYEGLGGKLGPYGPILPSDYEFCGGVVREYKKPNIGIGAVILPSNEAREIFGCTDKIFPGWFWGVTEDAPGFYSCIFEGSLTMWAMNNTINDKADIVIVSNRYRPDHFYITAEPPEQIKPINNWATYKVKIVNHIYSEDQTEFELKLNYPENVECEWENEDSDLTTITLSNNTEDSLNFKCRATQTGDYEIKVRAQGSIYDDWANVKLHSTTYDLDCIPQGCKIKIYAGRENVREAVRVINKLGFDAVFNLNLEQENVVNCNFVGGSTVNIPNGGSADISIKCKPKPETAGNNYIVKISSSLGGYNLARSKEIEVEVVKCSGPLIIETLTTNNQKIEEVAAGNEVKLFVHTDDCGGQSFKIYANNSNYNKIDYHIFSGVLSISDSSWYITRSVSTPGTYSFYVFADLNGDGDTNDEGEMNFTTLKVLPPASQEGRSCSKCNNEWCTYSPSYYGICRHCNLLIICNWEDCKNSCDPQSCYMDDGLPPDEVCANYSNLCCISGNNTYYSNGPSTEIPCLSLDNLKENSVNRNFWWGGYNCDWFSCWLTVGNAKNILINDGLTATFQNDWPGSVEECRGIGGPNPSNPPQSLSSAQLTSISTPTGNHNACQLTESSPPYSTWIYIKISETSRPIYGLIVSIHLNNKMCDISDFPYLFTANTTTYSKFHIFLHNSSGWFNVTTFEVIANESMDKIINITPQNEFAWKDIDSILIGHGHTYNKRRCFFVVSGLGAVYSDKIDDVDAYIDYVGLLTADKKTPYCTDGSGRFNRIVNDAKVCYWGLDCPIAGNGWSYKGKSTYTGIFGECDCFSGTCGLGYCERVIDGNRFCFSGIKCMNGGWVFENFEKCGVLETCTWKGCVCEGCMSI
ncbi:MAG: hypothetical protein QXP77_00065 [Candidatus Aenigmatarchaeota archaeon]